MDDADFVHRPFADAGVHQRLRDGGSILLVKRDRGFELGKLPSHERIDSAEQVAFGGSAVFDQHLTQPVKRMVDLRQRGRVGLEIFFLTGQQVPALACFGIDDECHRFQQVGLHFEGDRHLPVGDFEATKTELGIDRNRERNQDPQDQGNDDLEREGRFDHVASGADSESEPKYSLRRESQCPSGTVRYTHMALAFRESLADFASRCWTPKGRRPQ